MVKYSKNEINNLIKESKETTKWREYLIMVNKPSRAKRFNQSDLSRKEKQSIKNFWNDIYDDTKMIKLSKNAIQRVRENNEIKLLIDLDLKDFDNLISV